MSESLKPSKSRLLPRSLISTFESILVYLLSKARGGNEKKGNFARYDKEASSLLFHQRNTWSRRLVKLTNCVSRWSVRDFPLSEPDLSELFEPVRFLKSCFCEKMGKWTKLEKCGVKTKEIKPKENVENDWKICFWDRKSMNCVLWWFSFGFGCPGVRISWIWSVESWFRISEDSCRFFLFE